MRTDTHAIKNATEATARGVLTAHGINEKEANAYAEATSEATVEAIVMSQQDLVTKQDLDVAVAGLRTEMANLRTEMKTDNEKLRTEMKTDNEKLRTEMAKGNTKTLVYMTVVMGLFLSLFTYFNQARTAPPPLPGYEVQENRQIERRIERPAPEGLKPEQLESEAPSSP